MFQYSLKLRVTYSTV